MDGIEDRIQEMEDLLLLIQLENTKIKEKFSLDITEKPSEKPRPMPADLEERLSRLESLSKPAESGMPKNISLMLEAMKSRVQEIDDLKAKVTNAERTFRSEIERLETLKMPSEKSIEQYLEKISRAKYELDRELEQVKSIKNELEAVSREKQPMIQRISESEINIDKTDALLTKIRTLEEKIHADIERIESLKDGIDSKMRFAFDKIEMAKKDIESRISASEEKLKARVEKIDSVKESLDTKLSVAEDKISELEKFGSDMESIKRSVSSYSALPADVTSIKKQLSALSSLKETVDEEAATRISIEKRIQDIGRKLKTIEDLRSSVDEESIDIISIEKRLQDADNKLSSLSGVSGDITMMKKHLAELYQQKDSAKEDEVLKASIEKRLQEMNNDISLLKKGETGDISHIREQIEKEIVKEKEALMAKINEIKASIEKDSKLMGESEIRKMHSDVAEQKKAIDGMERKLEASAIKFFTENLEEFSRAVDRKLPELVRREDYEKDIREFARKMQVIEAPDITPISTRVYMLEKKIDDVYALMRSLSTRLPVVVE